MKKLQQWFNELTQQKQKLALLGFCLLFGLLLSLSIRYSQITMKTGSIKQPRITTNSIKTKK
ncbi:MAG: hypothetical protein V4553_02485 [Bacteroidota bacterium]